MIDKFLLIPDDEDRRADELLPEARRAAECRFGASLPDDATVRRNDDWLHVGIDLSTYNPADLLDIPFPPAVQEDK